METLEQLHSQLDSLRELSDIVRTMKALSAASIRQYEEAVRALQGYYRNVERGLYVVLRDMELPSGDMPRAAARSARTREPERLVAVVFGSDHGLCGRFNEVISEHAVQQLDATGVAPENRLLLAVGARVAASLVSADQKVEEVFLVPGSADQITATVQQILLKVDEWRAQSRVHGVYLLFNSHSEGSRYEPATVELLPLDLRRFRHLREKSWPSKNLPTFSMDRDRLLSRLVHQYLFVSIFRACAESQASEHGSRLAAMQSAERNLDERLDDVTMAYRRARQDSVTSELLDVIGGFEAITGGGD